MSEEQDLLDKIKANLAKDIKIIFEKSTSPTLIYSILNVYLQMQILDRLVDISDNIAAMRDNSDAECRERHNR